MKKILGESGRVEIEINNREVYKVTEIQCDDFEALRKHNVIVETEKYIEVNGINYTKSKFLDIYFENRKHQLINNDTSGKLILSGMVDDFLRCSHEDFTTWESCFAPDGCYKQSVLAFIKSKQVIMALITNSDNTKIIGRRWLIVIEDMIFGLYTYGTFPASYDIATKQYLEKTFFDGKKINYISKDDAYEIIKYIGSSTSSTGWGLRYGGSEDYEGVGGAETYIDNPLYLISTKTESEIMERVEENDTCLDISRINNIDMCECAHCGDSVHEDDAYRGFDGTQYCCEDCRDAECVYSDIEDDYINRYNASQIYSNQELIWVLDSYKYNNCIEIKAITRLNDYTWVWLDEADYEDYIVEVEDEQYIHFDDLEGSIYGVYDTDEIRERIFTQLNKVDPEIEVEDDDYEEDDVEEVTHEVPKQREND